MTKELATKSTVPPSGSARCTTSVPTTVPAPGRFSTTTVGPCSLPISSDNRRERMSGPLPGVYGTMILIVLFCAPAS